MSGNPRFDGTASDERFSFNGDPLVRICTIGQCPAAGHPPWANGWRFYRLHNDTLHARFYMSADRRQWRVQRKNTGTRLELGSADSSDEGIEYLDGDQTKIVRWRLMRQVEVLHGERNFVKYHWERGNRGLLYLTDILDTPPAQVLDRTSTSPIIQSSTTSLPTTRRFDGSTVPRTPFPSCGWHRFSSQARHSPGQVPRLSSSGAIGFVMPSLDPLPRIRDRRWRPFGIIRSFGKFSWKGNAASLKPTATCRRLPPRNA